MLSLLLPPANSRDVAIKAHPSYSQNHTPNRTPEDGEIPLSDGLKIALTLKVSSNGQRWLSEVVSVSPFITTFRDVEPVKDYSQAVTRSYELGRPLLDQTLIEETVANLRKKHAQSECDACGKVVAIKDLTKHDKTVTPPAQVCPECHEEKGCPFDENLKQITTVPFSISIAKPTDPNREWSLYAIRSNGLTLESKNLTCRDAQDLQLKEIHHGATWTAIFRTEKRFFILADTAGEPPYESQAWQTEVDARLIQITKNQTR